MVDSGKVVKGLECCVRSDSEAECPTECPYYRKCWEDDYPDGKLALSLHKDALELLKEQPAKDTNVLGKWISVKDRLPEATEPDVKGNIVFSKKVLVYEVYEDGFTYTTVSQCNVAMGSWLSEVPSFGCKVTHWMPIPEPPEEVKKGCD